MLQETKLRFPRAFDFLWTPSRYKAAHGGRGGAKSHSFASRLVLMGSERPIRWLCCREIQKSIATSVKQLLDDKIKAAGLGPVEDGGNGLYRSTDRSIRGGNGTEFLFAGLRTNPDSVKSMEGLDGAWIEEANTVSRSSINLLTPTVRKDGSEIWASWNRRNVSDPVDDMFLGPKGPPPRSIVRKVDWRDNPWFPGVLHEEMMWDKSRDRDKWLHVWEGEPVVRSEARVFQNWRVDDLDDTGILDETPRLGADWGFAVDPTVLVECYVRDRTLYFRREAFKVRCEIDETPSLFAGSDGRDPPRWTNAFSHVGLESVRRGHRIVADSARPETISYMKKRGFRIVRARKGAGSVEEGVEFMKSYDIVVHPDCVHVADEMTHYSYKEDPLTDEVLPELADRHNHTIDAARYAVEDVRRRARGTVGVFGGEAVEMEEG